MRFELISVISLFGLLASCSSAPQIKSSTNTAEELPFEYFEKDYLVVPVSLNGLPPRKFILDTGIGITLISQALWTQLKCTATSEHTGHRMSGQAIRVPMGSVRSIQVGAREAKDFPVGLFDIETLMPGSDIAGFLSLGFFKDFPHTVDYRKKVIRFETAQSLRELRASGTAVALTLNIKGPSLTAFMPMVLPDGLQAQVEVDTGSQSLILHEKYMKQLGISPDGTGVKRREGRDETGHSYVRYFSKLKGAIHLPGAAEMKMEAPAVMFQKIIYDGLIGVHFLREFKVTYDLARREMIFSRPMN